MKKTIKEVMKKAKEDFERRKGKNKVFRMGDVVTLSDSLVITGNQVRHFKDEDREAVVERTPISKAVVVTWDETNVLHTMACVELYDQSENKHVLVDIRGELLTMVHRFRIADEVILMEDLNLAHDGVKINDVMDSRGRDDPQWNPPLKGSRGMIVVTGAPALVSFAVPSLDGSEHMIELFIVMPPYLLAPVQLGTNSSDDSSDDLSEDDE